MKLSVLTNLGREHMVIPDDWDQVSTEKFELMHSDWDASDIVKLFSIMTGSEYKWLFNKVDPSLERTLIQSMKFVTNQNYKKGSVPKTITIDSRIVNIPSRIGGLSIGQSIHVRQKMEEVKVLEQCLSYATAIYLQPLYDRAEFNHDSVMILHKKIQKMPITEIYPIGFFLLSRLTRSGSDFMSKVRNTFIRCFHLSLRNESR